MLFPTTFPSLHSERLLLRQIVPKDLPNIYQGLSDKKVIRYYGVSFASLEATEAQMEWYEQLWAEQTGIWWAICAKETGTFLGACGYNEYQPHHKKIELGYWLLPLHWKKGYVSEALQLVVPYAFENLEINRIEAFVETGNVASDKVLKKLQFIHEDTLRNCEYKNDRFISLKVFGRQG
ncbi:MAG: GNAT family N-acetyltransferase [Saprospiraceae bacterium]